MNSVVKGFRWWILAVGNILIFSVAFASLLCYKVLNEKGVNYMNLKDIKVIAGENGVKAGKMKKEEIIRAIQRAEGNFDCFRTAVSSNCGQSDCLWREDCLKM